MGEYASILHNCRYRRLRLYRQQLCKSPFAASHHLHIPYKGPEILKYGITHIFNIVLGVFVNATHFSWIKTVERYLESPICILKIDT